MQQRWIHREPTASTLFPECHQGGYSMCRVVGRPKNEPPLSQATGMRLRGPVGVCLSHTPSNRLTNRFSATLKISPASSRCAHACKLVLRKNSLPHTSQWLFPRETPGHSEPHHGQTGNHMEMPDIAGCHSISKF